MPWTVNCQFPLSMEFSSVEDTWVGCHSLSRGYAQSRLNPALRQTLMSPPEAWVVPQIELAIKTPANKVQTDGCWEIYCKPSKRTNIILKFYSKAEQRILLNSFYEATSTHTKTNYSTGKEKLRKLIPSNYYSKKILKYNIIKNQI